MEFGELSPFTCPECHGVLARLREGSIVRFRCHTGHAFTAATLLAALGEQVEARLWDTLRATDETVMLLRHFGTHLKEAGEAAEARRYFAKADDVMARSQPLREAASHPTELGARELQAAKAK